MFCFWREHFHLFALNPITWFKLEVSSQARGTRDSPISNWEEKAGQASVIQCHEKQREEFLQGGDNTVQPFRKGASENGMIVVDLRGKN